MNKVKAHLTVIGKVQRVYFRQTMKKQAHLFGVAGWVRNQPNGDVEAVLEGPQEAVEALIKWCHQGPQAAKVTSVLIKWENPKDEFYEFAIIR